MEVKRILLTLFNHHAPSCGVPPGLDNDDRTKYIGYFQNCHGEQMIFMYDYEAHVGSVTHGDAGWETIYPVEKGIAPGLRMNKNEQMWLAACWDAATRFRT